MTLVPNNVTKRLLESRTQEYQNQLPGSQGEKYLESRGISKEAQSYFRLGFVGNPEPSERMYGGRISIPYIAGQSVVGIKYRAAGSGDPRYLSSVGFESRRLFNSRVLKTLTRTVYVTEGEIDAITLHVVGVNAVAVPGANAWNPIAARAFRNRFVVVVADGDDTGQSVKWAKQILTSVDSGGMIVMEGTDVNQFYLDKGGEALLEYIGIRGNA